VEHVAAFQYTSFNLTGGGEPRRVRAAQVQPDLFAALGARPIAGRAFLPEEDEPGRERVVLLSEGLWRDQFGGDRSIVGRAIALDGTPYVVVGVMPRSLRLPIDYSTRSATQLWVPIALGPADPQARGSHGLFALGRLRAGSTLAQAQAEIDAITRLVRQLLTEALLLSLTGGIIGIALAKASIALLVALDPLKIPRVGDVAIDGRVLAFTTAVALATGVIFGLIPALHAARADPQPA